MTDTANDPASRRARRILWLNVLTVLSAAILISAEVFGAAFAGSWAIANLFALGTLGARVLDGFFMLLGIVGDGAVRARRASRRAVHGRLTRRPRRRCTAKLGALLFLKTK